MKLQHRGYEIRKSGKQLYRIYQDGEPTIWPRVVSIEAAYATINANVEKRVMTPEEHHIVYPTYRAWRAGELTE